MPLPDRWEEYSPLGNVIPGTNLVAFKVPLKQSFQERLTDEKRFSPSILIQQMRSQSLFLGLVIDLTFTQKYYNAQEFIQNEVEYKKIYTEGKHIPSDGVYNRFATTIKQFKHPDQIIGVHCTHGINRTGYLICRYMIEELKLEPEDAIKLFNEARGHNIERENYLEDLKRRTPGEVTPSYGKIKKKPRWRDHREDHPGWRRQEQEHPPSQRTNFCHRPCTSYGNSAPPDFVRHGGRGREFYGSGNQGADFCDGEFSGRNKRDFGRPGSWGKERNFRRDGFYPNESREEGFANHGNCEFSRDHPTPMSHNESSGRFTHGQQFRGRRGMRQFSFPQGFNYRGGFWRGRGWNTRGRGDPLS